MAFDRYLNINFFRITFGKTKQNKLILLDYLWLSKKIICIDNDMPHLS